MNIYKSKKFEAVPSGEKVTYTLGNISLDQILVANSASYVKVVLTVPDLELEITTFSSGDGGTLNLPFVRSIEIRNQATITLLQRSGMPQDLYLTIIGTTDVA